VTGQAGDQLGDGNAFFTGLVRQHRTAHAVADRPHAIDAGVAVFVHRDLAALSQLHAAVVRQQALGSRAPAHRNQQLVELRGVLFLAVAVSDVHDVALHRNRADLGAELDVEALFLELARRHFGDIGVGGCKKVGQGFEHGDLAAEPAPDAAELEPDHAGTDHAEALGHLVEIQGTSVVDYMFSVELGERQFDRNRTRCQNHIGRAV